jgi:predicted aldo/keto reductase-like oxidoreductase
VNFRSPPKLFRAIEQAADAGVGIIAMKTQNGGYQDGAWPELTPHQAALRYVLDKPGIHLAVPGMLSRKMIDENLQAVTRKKDLADLLELENYRANLQGRACSFCSECIGRCRHGTGGLDVARILMYSEGYGDIDLAVSRGKEVLSRLRLCSTCESCTAGCSQGIDIKASAQKVLRYVS